MADGAQKPTGNPRTFEAPVYGSDEAIAELRPTYGLGGLPEPSREELAAMQKGPYLLHARGASSAGFLLRRRSCRAIP